MSQAIAGQEALISVLLVELNLDSGVVRLTTSGTDVQYMGYTYISSRDLLTVGAASHKGSINTTPLNFTLPVTENFLAVVNSHSYRNRSVVVTRIYLDEDGNVIGNPSVIHQGVATGADISIDDKSGKSQITLNTSNIWAKFDRPSGLRTNNETQQRWYPDDKGFEYANVTNNQKENWKARDAQS